MDTYGSWTGTRTDAAPGSAGAPSERRRPHWDISESGVMVHVEKSLLPDDPAARNAGRGSAGREEGPRGARTRHRPDVSGHFAVALVCALTSGFFLGADLLRENLGFGQSLAFAAVHPMSYILGCCLALLAVLLIVGDV
jgi:hypothetical protein